MTETLHKSKIFNEVLQGMGEHIDKFAEMERKNKKNFFNQSENNIFLDKSPSFWIDSCSSESGEENILKIFTEIMKKNYEERFSFDYIVKKEDLLTLTKLILTIDFKSVPLKKERLCFKNGISCGSSIMKQLSPKQRKLFVTMAGQKYESLDEEMKIYKKYLLKEYSDYVISESRMEKTIEKIRVEHKKRFVTDEISCTVNKTMADKLKKAIWYAGALNYDFSFCPVTFDYLKSCIINCMVRYDEEMTNDLKIMHSVIGVFLNLEKDDSCINVFNDAQLTKTFNEYNQLDTNMLEEKKQLFLKTVVAEQKYWNANSLLRYSAMNIDLCTGESFEIILERIIQEVMRDEDVSLNISRLWYKSWNIALKSDATSMQKVLENGNTKYYDLLRERAGFCFAVTILLDYINVLENAGFKELEKEELGKDELFNKLESKDLEIERLKKQLAQAKVETKNELKATYEKRIRKLENSDKQYEAQITKLNDKIKDYENIKQENIALKKFVESADAVEDALTINEEKDIEKSLPQDDVIVIGGHDSWQSKLKDRFPLWQFISGGDKSWDVKKLNKKYIIVNTTHLGHPTYYKITNNLKGKKVIYASKVNIDQALQEIYAQI